MGCYPHSVGRKTEAKWLQPGGWGWKFAGARGLAYAGTAQVTKGTKEQGGGLSSRARMGLRELLQAILVGLLLPQLSITKLSPMACKIFQ